MEKFYSKIQISNSGTLVTEQLVNNYCCKNVAKFSFKQRKKLWNLLFI